MKLDHIEHADVMDYLRSLPDQCVNLVVTSPPYLGLRSYLPEGHPDKAHEIGAEQTPAAYIARMVDVFREVRRVLRDDGSVYCNLGDSYANKPVGKFNGGGFKDGSTGRDLSGVETSGKMDKVAASGLPEKSLIGIPWRFAIAMQDDGWLLREDIIWQKPTCMPESVRDRCTRSHEYIFHFTKQARYWYDQQAVSEPVKPYDVAKPMVNGTDGKVFDGRGDVERLSRRGRAARMEMYKENGLRNRRSVWTINPASFSGWLETVRRHPVSVHELSGGTKRIASPDCPVHGSKDHPGSTYVCDAHEADELSRNAGIYARLAQARSADCASTDQKSASGLPEQSSGLLPPDCVPSATPHSTQSHKTDLAPATSPPCTPSGETASRTGDTSAEPASVVLHPDTPANNTSPDAMGAHSPGQTSGDTAGILSSASLLCTCQFYRETTEKTSHFATFPEDIPEICIKAACPEWCCEKCGAPYEAQVERELANTEGWGKATKDHTGNISGANTIIRNGNGRAGDPVVTHNGYAPSCTCNAGKRAGVVLDPFMGAGTVALVAKRLNRRYIGCDLNAEYVEMARARIDSIPYTLFSLMATGD